MLWLTLFEVLSSHMQKVAVTVGQGPLVPFPQRNLFCPIHNTLDTLELHIIFINEKSSNSLVWWKQVSTKSWNAQMATIKQWAIYKLVDNGK